MDTHDFIVFNIPIAMNSYDDVFKEDFEKICNSLMHFLSDNSLLIGANPFNDDGTLNLNTEIRLSNLTVEEIALFKNKTVDGWVGYFDRSTSPNRFNNISRLEKGLAKLRKAKK